MHLITPYLSCHVRTCRKLENVFWVKRVVEISAVEPPLVESHVEDAGLMGTGMIGFEITTSVARVNDMHASELRRLLNSANSTMMVNVGDEIQRRDVALTVARLP